MTQLSQVSLTLYLLGVKKELSGVNSATLHGVKRTFDCLRMRFKRKSIVLSEAVTPFYFTKLTPVYYLRNFSFVICFMFAVVVLVQSCGHNSERLLNDDFSMIDSLMWDNPDSAYLILKKDSLLRSRVFGLLCYT